MSPEDFIRALKIAVHDAGVRAVRETLEHPPGRKPETSVVELSDWYHSLPHSDKEKLMQVVQHAVQASVFNFLCVLDGVSAIEDTQRKGELELYYVRDGVRKLLNDQGDECLHEVYQGEVYEEVFGKKG
jgi:hypothetical protein